MIVTDGTHVVSTESLDELHEWAKDNNIGKHWFHGIRKGHPHYDIPKRSWIRFYIRHVRPRELLQYSKRLITNRVSVN